MNALLTWLGSIPPGMLYVVAGVMAFVECIFPPSPSDMIIAFAVFLTARNGGPLWAAAVATWIGSLSGAMLMYYVGRRYGAQLVVQKLEGAAGVGATKRLIALHAKYGVLALVVSRFLPGVRAIVPPVAGAMQMPVFQVAISMGIASALWYGFVSYLAYQTGENWPAVSAHIAHSTALLGIGAAVLVGLGLLFWAIRFFLRRRRRQRQDS